MNAEKICHLCYELYKSDWKHTHMITWEREMDSIKDYYDGLEDDESDYSYAEFIEEFGYSGELYVCYEEFCDNEYLDENYIIGLLARDDLIAMYRADLRSIYEDAEEDDNE